MKSSNRILIVSAAILFVFLAPYIFRGQGIHMKIADVMDAWVPQQKVLAESGKAFSLNPDTRIDNFLDGLRISGFTTGGYNVITVLFMIFSPFTAFTLNVFIMAFTAFFGMRLLLRDFILRGNGENEWIINGAALCFALLPFYPSSGLSIAGLPLLVYSFLNIRDNKWSKWDFAYIAFFPFYSILSHAGLFIMISLAVLFIVHWVRSRQFHVPYFIGLAIMGGLYVFTHFHLFYSIIDPNFTSYRVEIKVVPMGFVACFKEFLHNVVLDRSNTIAAQRFFVVGAAAVGVVLGFIKKVKEVKILLVLVLFTVFNAFLWGFKYWQGIHFLREKYQFFNTLNLARFYWLNPFLWYVVFGLSLWIIWRVKFGKAIVLFLLAGQLVFMFGNYNFEYRYLAGGKLRYTHSLSYREYYSEPLFKNIAQYIGKPKADYRVASLGIPPGISQYNGFYTLDIFSNVYPLEYKHRFRRIITKELEKDGNVKTVFDDNGKRCYLLSAEIHNRGRRWWTFARGIGKDRAHVKIRDLELDTGVFAEMGGEYILSAVEILNYAENGLIFEKRFETEASPWIIYLYRVGPRENTI